MTYGVSVLKEHHFHGSSLTVEGSNRRLEFTTQLLYAKQEVQLEWWLSSEEERVTKAVCLILGAYGDIEMADGIGLKRLTKVRQKDLFLDTSTQPFSLDLLWWLLVEEQTQSEK